MSETNSIAAEAVCDAIRRHATACQNEPGNVQSVVSAGEALSKSVLEYEKVLATYSGWSNPIRHLGPLPIYASASAESTEDSAHLTIPIKGPSFGIVLEARYSLHVENEDALLTFVEGRYGDRVSTLKQAIDLLFRADSWDPRHYPPGLLQLDEVEVETTVEPPE